MPSKKEKAEAARQKVRAGMHTHGIFYVTTINKLTLLYATILSYPGPCRRQRSKEGRSQQEGRCKDQARRKEEKAREIALGCRRKTDGVVKELGEMRL
jgi:hypothetical protein